MQRITRTIVFMSMTVLAASCGSPTTQKQEPDVISISTCEDEGTCATKGDSDDESCTADSVCGDDDGCCPSGCDNFSDADCVNTCGDGVVVAGEVCDGNCPTSCDDGDACTVDGSSGAADLCNLVCTHAEITACVDGDGCCATGCTSATDDDCTCEPTTCAAAGAACGTIDDGCGGTLSCGSCAGSQSCQNHQCTDVVIGEVGDACASDSDCEIDCITVPDFKDGFCTAGCSDDFDCASGSHCISLPGYSSKICAPNCQADNDCRSDGYGCWDIDDDGDKECAPAPQGSSDFGEACTGLYDCDSYANLCADGSSFPGGYCTRSCYFNGECPGGSVCMTNPNGPGYCAVECTGASDCRSQYTCHEATNDITGETIGVCLGG